MITDTLNRWIAERNEAAIGEETADTQTDKMYYRARVKALQECIEDLKKLPHDGSISEFKVGEEIEVPIKPRPIPSSYGSAEVRGSVGPSNDGEIGISIDIRNQTHRYKLSRESVEFLRGALRDVPTPTH